MTSSEKNRPASLTSPSLLIYDQQLSVTNQQCYERKHNEASYDAERQFPRAYQFSTLSVFANSIATSCKPILNLLAKPIRVYFANDIGWERDTLAAADRHTLTMCDSHMVTVQKQCRLYSGYFYIIA